MIAILAVISFVLYSGIRERASATATLSSLSQASKEIKMYETENGSFPASLSATSIKNTESIAYEYTVKNTDPKGFCLTAINNSTIYRVTESTGPAKGGCSGHSFPGSVSMTNLVTNGDFQGTASWSCTICTLSSANNTLTATVTSVGGHAAIYSKIPGGIKGGNVYYASFSMNPFNPHRPAIYVGKYHEMPSAIPANTFTRVSDNITALADQNDVTIRLNRYDTTGMSIGSTVQFRHIILINLTDTFGAGNEPTKSQMNTILQSFPNSWFSGTARVDVTSLP